MSDKSGGLLLPSLLRTYRVPFDTIGSSMHLSSKIRVSLFLLARYIRFLQTIYMPLDFVPFNTFPIGCIWFRGLTNVIICS